MEAFRNMASGWVGKVLLTLLVLSGVNAVGVISKLESSNDEILQEFLGRETRLDELRSAISLCTSTAQRTASTTLANSMSKPSPVVFTMRP